MKQPMKKLFYLSLLLAVLAAAGCTKSFRQETPVLSVDALEITASSTADTLRVTTNRSWGASRLSGEDWLSLSVTGGENMAGVLRTYILPMTLEYNLTGEPREAEIRISCEEGLSKTIKIKQL